MSAARRIVLACLLLVLLPQAVPAQPPPMFKPADASDPVDRVRQALFNFRAAPDAKKAQEELNGS